VRREWLSRERRRQFIFDLHPETFAEAPLHAPSLADFIYSDTDNPLVPPEDFRQTRRLLEDMVSLYEPSLLGAPEPRVDLEIDNQPHPVINLSSYNYLGLAKHPETIAAAQETLATYGTGACGSPILSGMTDLHRRLETQMSAFLGREATMLFNSGFSGAMGTLSGLLQKGDVAILDSKCHMSLIDGALLSKARVEFFEHNNPEALDGVLRRHEGKRRLIAVEGVYSMDGDMADLPVLLDVAEQHGVGVLIDEAHSILACGENGRGVVEHYGVEGRVALQYGTFSKGFAGIGGFTSGNADTLDYLRCYAHPYHFSCALPPAVVAALSKALEVATRDNSLREKLRENSEYFRTQLHNLGLDTGASTSQVIPIIIGANRMLLYDLCAEMRERGLFLVPVDFPAVPEDQVRFRASVTAAHTRADLDEALNIIADTVVKRLRGA
jgi:glycine C-acetyltransferase